MAIALYVVGAAASITAWMVGRWYLTRPAVPEHAGCGYCGYSVEGLPSGTCPECGRHLDVVGIRRQTAFWGLSAGTRLILSLLSFSLAYALAAVLIWIPFDTYLRPGRYWAVDVVSFDAPSRSASWQLSRIKIATCWPWERSSVFPSMANPDIWSVETSRDPGVVGLGASEIMLGSFPGPFPLRQFTVFKAGYHRWMDPETGKGRVEGGVWRDNLDAWLATWSLTMKEPQLRSQVVTILPLALAMPHARASYGVNLGGHRVGDAWMHTWEASPAWAWSFWAGLSLPYLLALLCLFRSSTYCRATRAQTAKGGQRDSSRH